MKKLLLAIVMTAACLMSARAAISVGSGGSGVLAFPTNPIVTEFATAVLNGTATTYVTTNGLDAGVNTVSASSNFFVALPVATTTPPGTFSGGFRWNSAAAGLYLQSRPTTDGTNAANIMLATLQNTSGGTITDVNISYAFTYLNQTVEEISGFRVFWSLTGAVGSWTPLPTLSNNTNAGTHSASFNVGAWPDTTLLYLLWADDNSGATDGGYTIDNMNITSGGLPLSVTLTAPTNSVLVTPATVALSATTLGTVPATSVSFFTNGVLHSTDNTAPYAGTLNNLPTGIYSVHAVAVNGSETAFSATNIVVVRPDTIPYSAGTLTENFDGMGAGGPFSIVTPQGWWVGAAAAGSAQFVTVGDGGVLPQASVHGWNYGLTGDGNRSLGTSPTGADRNVTVRIQNIGAANIDAFNLAFEIELWRTHNTNTHIEVITNYVSFDLGATWIPTTFNVSSPNTADYPASSAMDGNQATNRVAAGGAVVPPTPVPPGGVIYIRWNNFNDPGTDGGLAVDDFSFEATAFSPATHFVNITSPANGVTLSGGCFGATNVTVTATASFTTTNVAFQIDGGAVINDSTAPFSVTFPAVGIAPHTITATALNSAGATAVTNSAFTVQGNTSPIVLYTNVYSLGATGTTFLVGSPVTNQFGITDDGGITNVQFFVNGNLLYSTNINFGQIVANNLLFGTNTFTVRATDTCGGVTQASQLVYGTNPAAPIVVIVPNGSLWKYNNVGVQPPNDGEGDIWYSPNFNDSAWLSGFAELGGGDAVTPPNTVPERTPINIGPSTNRYTIYFRHTFNVVTPALYPGLTVRGLQDDGSAVYLNGTLVAAFNMTNGPGVPFAYTDLAGPLDPIPDDGTRYYASNIVNSLVVGVNTLAVEVHQSDIGSSDLSFDLMLWSAPPAAVALRIVPISATQSEISWADTTPGGVQLYSTTDITPTATWSLVGLPVTQSGGFNRVTVNTADLQRFYTLRQ